MMLKTCKQCKKKFNSYRKRQKFCSVQCSVDSRKKRLEKKCLNCGVYFFTRPSRNEITKHCCIKCKVEHAKKQLKEKTCKICGSFFSPVLKCRQDKQTTCSKECYGIYKRVMPNKDYGRRAAIERRGELAANWKGKNCCQRTNYIIFRKQCAEKPNECMNFNCLKKTHVFRWAMIDYEAGRKVENFAYLCLSCLIRKTQLKIEPNWNEEALLALHKKMRRTVIEKNIHGI